MNSERSEIYRLWAPIYQKRGLEPRPVQPGSKACKIKGWTKADDEISATTLKSWIDKYPNHGIGLRMGTPLPGGGHLGALDIDRDEYVGLGRVLLNDPPCGRFGSKGAVFFVRVMGEISNSKFKVKGEFAERYGQVVECLFNRTLCVIPPTIHPDTHEAYTWIGTPLHELDFDLLPVIGE